MICSKHKDQDEKSCKCVYSNNHIIHICYVFCGYPPTNLRLPKEYTRPINVSIQLCKPRAPASSTQFFLITPLASAISLTHLHSLTQSITLSVFGGEIGVLSYLYSRLESSKVARQTSTYQSLEEDINRRYSIH